MESPTDLCALKNERQQLKGILEEREEVLRKLKLIKALKEKGDMAQLDSLVVKWREACQQAILDLHAMQPEPRPSLSAMINSWNIDHKMIGFNEDEESFG